MADEIKTFFDQLAKRGYEPLLHTFTGACRFEVEGEKHWNVTLKEGAISVSTDTLKTDCTIKGSRELFTRIIHGEQNPMTAFMQGKLAVIGDLALAEMFGYLFRIRPETVAMSGGKQT